MISEEELRVIGETLEQMDKELAVMSSTSNLNEYIMPEDLEQNVYYALSLVEGIRNAEDFD